MERYGWELDVISKQEDFQDEDLRFELSMFNIVRYGQQKLGVED